MARHHFDMTELSSGFVFLAAAYIVFLSALSGVAVMLTVVTVEQPLPERIHQI